MKFNSLEFVLFLPIVFSVYWFLLRDKLRYQNLFVLGASYVFYGWWDWRFLSLIFLSSLIDYFVGIQLDKPGSPRRRKLLLMLSLGSNLGMLGFFKYCDFFLESFGAMINSFGFHADVPTLRIILPVGISFYTFQTLSYSIDIYRRKISSINDPIAFFAFVSFFPQLVAGPIERARDLLPQFLKPREFEEKKFIDGLRQILWGFFKKVMIADNLAPIVNSIFVDYAHQEGQTLVLGVFFFAVQIYCDFSGYSDIAIGTARLFGFQLTRNFAYPYFSRDIAEFWRRWHISLSSWFRDYVYIPLGGSRSSRWRRIFNIIVTFTVSGFWHGANWTFIFWGLLNGLYYIPLMLTNKQKIHTNVVAEGRIFPSLKEILQMFSTFLLTLLAWVFFRATSMSEALDYLARIFSSNWGLAFSNQSIVYLFFIGILFTVEWLQRDRQYGLEIRYLPQWVRWPVYISLLVAVLLLGNLGEVEFIYFQF